MMKQMFANVEHRAEGDLGARVLVSSVLVQPDGRGPHSPPGNRTNASRRFGVRARQRGKRTTSDLD